MSKANIVNLPPAGTDDELPTIILKGGNLPWVTDQAEKALIASKENVFVQGERLVKPVDTCSNSSEGIRRQSGSIILMQISITHLTELFGRSAVFKKYDARIQDYKIVDPPRTLADTCLARGTWPFRTLAGIIEAPTIKDGVVLDKPGYHESSGLYLAGNIPSTYSAPPNNPTIDEAKVALDQLNIALGEFPFLGPDDHAAAISSILTAITVRTRDASPAIGIPAPTPGSGKSTLGDILSIIATGRRAPVIGQGDDQSEFEKRLTGVFLAGDIVVMIDNLERPLYGDMVCQAITQPSLRLRPLGISQLITVPTNCLLIANGNNLDIRGDMRRRVLLIRLDAKTERPEQRNFKMDILKYVNRNRGSLIKAALTIQLAYQAAGFPEVDIRPFNGFADWDKWCRRPLVWLGLPDPLVASEALREADPDLAAQRQLYAEWFERFGERSLTSKEVIDGAGDEMRVMLSEICAEHISTRRLGNWLRRHKGRMIDGLQLDSITDTHKKIQRWRLIKCG